jgi:LacI family transcriptional regulator
MKVTSQTIADLAGVSRGTVDRALKGRGQIRPEVKERILRIAKALDYSPNPAATALVRGKKKRRVKLVIHHTGSYYWRDLKLFFEEAAAEFRDFGLSLDITELSGDETEEMVEALDACLSRPPDYLIVAPHNTDAMRAKLQEVMDREIPLLTIDTTIDDNPSPCHIGTNPEDDGRIMAGLFHFAFAEHTPRLLTLYRYQFHLASTYRKRAFFDELDHLGQTYEVVEDAVITGLPESSYHKTRQLLEKHPELDAIFVASGNTEGVCNALIDAGRTGTLKVYAYDITGNLRRYLDEGVVTATLCQSNRLIAEAAMKYVADEIIFGRQNNESFIVTPNLIKLRQSPD